MSLPPIRAPREHGAVFALPPLAEAGQLIAANRSFPASWQELRSQARRETLVAAMQYLRDAGEPNPEPRSDSLLLAGHQPELFHPGVWVKNFALHGLANRLGLTPLNLVIDTDTAKWPALHVPVLDATTSEVPANFVDEPFAPLPQLGHPRPLAHLARVPLDEWKGDIPYEERHVANEELFHSIADRIGELTSNWPFQPMLSEFWDEVLCAAQRTNLLGERLAAARRAVERRWGCANLEAPMSRVCGTASFAKFVGHLLQGLSDFHTAHNSALTDYRARHGIASRNRPVAELAREGDWLEAPLWAWKRSASHRQRLFVRATDAGFELRAGEERWPSLPADADGLQRIWREMAEDGLKIRSRALTTTMFARLFLGDAFIHGIGGAKYDELNDEIIRRFYRIEPPKYMVLSATLLLPFPHYAADPAAISRLTRERRDRWYNPARHLANEERRQPAIRELLAERTNWLQRGRESKAARQARYRAFRQINHRLREAARTQQQQVTRQLLLAKQHVEANEVLGRRDFAFCLYPEEMIKPFCQRFLT